MASLRDVAAAAGVSPSVASRALNGDMNARISTETARRVRAAATRLNYVPNHSARAFRSSRALALGLVVPDVNNAVFADLFSGVKEVAEAEGLTVLLGQVGPTNGGRTLADVVGRGRVDGVILQRREDCTDADLTTMLDVSHPVVLFNSTLRRHTGSVILEDARAASIATQHLLELGHRRIGLIGGTAVHDAARRRATGFRDAMRSAGRRIDSDWVVNAGWEAAAGADGVAALLRARRPPTGIVVASVNAALGAASAAARRGVGVPHDLSIVTIQDTWMAQVATPALTVVRMPMREAGSVAASMLIRAFSGEAMSDLVVSHRAPKLVVRHSTASPLVS